MDGLQLAAKLRHALHRKVPVIILTGDILTATLDDITHYDCTQLSKLMKLNRAKSGYRVLLPKIQRAAEMHPKTTSETDNPEASVIFVVDDDHEVREVSAAV